MLCSRVQNLLSAYCDRELSGSEMLQIQRHLGDCPECRAEHAALQATKRLFGSLGEIESSRPFDMAVIEARAAAPAPVRFTLLGRLLEACRFRLQPVRFAARGLLSPSFGWDGSAVALGCALGALLLTVGTIRQPRPNATTAQIPVQTTVVPVAADSYVPDSAPVAMPGAVTATPPLGEPTVAPSTPWPRARYGAGFGSGLYPSGISFVGHDSSWSPR